MLIKYYTRDELTINTLANFVPGIVNFTVFIILSGILISEKMVKAELRRPTLSSTRTNILFFLLACSPVSFILYEIVTWTLSKYTLPLASWFPVVAITLFWFILDLFRRYFWQVQGLFSLSLSWVVTSIVCHFSRDLFLRGHEGWPITLILHGLVFSLFLIVERSISRR